MKDPSERTKVVVRHLPPSITQQAVMEQIDGRFAGRYDCVCFRPGKQSHKGQKHSRAYINFRRPEDVVEFAEFFDGHIFVNEKGSQFKAQVEYSPSQRIPKQWSKKDGREGTILKDPEYLEFLELISKPAEHLPSAEIQLERKEAERGASAKESIIVTPLMDFVRQKRAAKIGAQRSSASVRLSRRSAGASAGSSSPSKRGSDKRRGPTSVYVLRDSMKSGNGKDKPAYILVSKREEQQYQGDKSVVASAFGKDASEVDFASGALEAGKSKILLLKGKEKEGYDASGGLVHQQIASSLRNSPSSTSKQNQRLEASGRIIRGILSKEGRLGQPHAVSSQPEQPLPTTNTEKDKRPPRPPNMRSSVKDHGSSLSIADADEKRYSDDKVALSNTYGSVSISEKHDRRSRNKDRPDHGVWAPLRRSDRSPFGDESLSEAKEASIDSLGSITTSYHSAARIGEDDAVIHNARLGRGSSSVAIFERSQGPGERKHDLLFTNRSEDLKHHGGGRGSVSIMENGSHRQVGRRGSARGSREVDNSSSMSEGKVSKRPGYGSHEVPSHSNCQYACLAIYHSQKSIYLYNVQRQVWVQKSGSAS